MNNLPADILKIICYYLDFDSLENLFSISEYLDNVLVYDFWKPYFETRGIKITEKQDQPLSWINEYKTNEIMKIITDQKLITDQKSIQCQYVMKRGMNKGMMCQKSSEPGHELCGTHLRISNDTKQKQNYMQIECNNIELIICKANRVFVDNYTTNMIRNYLSSHKNTCLIKDSHHKYTIYAMYQENCALNQWITKQNCDPILGCWVVNKENLYKMLFDLFEEEEIISYKQITI